MKNELKLEYVFWNENAFKSLFLLCQLKLLDKNKKNQFCKLRHYIETNQ